MFKITILSLSLRNYFPKTQLSIALIIVIKCIPQYIHNDYNIFKQKVSNNYETTVFGTLNVTSSDINIRGISIWVNLVSWWSVPLAMDVILPLLFKVKVQDNIFYILTFNILIFTSTKKKCLVVIDNKNNYLRHIQLFWYPDSNLSDTIANNQQVKDYIGYIGSKCKQ